MSVPGSLDKQSVANHWDNGTETYALAAEGIVSEGDGVLAISVFGLPAHPLVVHITVVLVPLAALKSHRGGLE